MVAVLSGDEEGVEEGDVVGESAREEGKVEENV